MKSKRSTLRVKATLTLEEAMRRDLVIFNNPVLMQGLALTPVVAATTSLKNAIILGFISMLIIVPTRLAGELLFYIAPKAKRSAGDSPEAESVTSRYKNKGGIPQRLRMLVYALIASAFYIPALAAGFMFFGIDVRTIGIYIPMLVVDGVVLSRAEIPAREGILESVDNGFRTSVGLIFVMIITGAIREFLAEGKLWGIAVMKSGTLGIAGTVAGGFIIVALLSALLQWCAAAYKRAGHTGTEV